LPLEEAALPIADLLTRIDSEVGPPLKVDKVAVARRPDGRMVYLLTIEGTRDPWIYDAGTGEPVRSITDAEAAAIAHDDFTGAGIITGVTWIEDGSARDVEYSGPFPVYRVDFSNAKHTRLYISPFSGQILRRHNVYQTVRSAFWTLHVFGYLDPEVAWNVPLLVVSAVCFGGVVSGCMLLVPYFRRRVAAIAPAASALPAWTAQAQGE
jgi:hypothetical protein